MLGVYFVGKTPGSYKMKFDLTSVVVKDKDTVDCGLQYSDGWVTFANCLPLECDIDATTLFAENESMTESALLIGEHTNTLIMYLQT